MPSKTLSIGSGTLFIQSWAVAGLRQSLGLATRPYGPWQLITNLRAGSWNRGSLRRAGTSVPSFQ